MVLAALQEQIVVAAFGLEDVASDSSSILSNGQAGTRILRLNPLRAKSCWNAATSSAARARAFGGVLIVQPQLFENMSIVGCE
jgi:hypothetical protein